MRPEMEIQEENDLGKIQEAQAATISVFIDRSVKQTDTQRTKHMSIFVFVFLSSVASPAIKAHLDNGVDHNDVIRYK